jgi:hypothetical protein
MSATLLIWISLGSGAYELGLEQQAQPLWQGLLLEIRAEPRGLEVGLLASLVEDLAPGRALLGDLDRAVPHGIRRLALRELARKEDAWARRRIQFLLGALPPGDLQELARAALAGKSTD